MAPYQPRGAVIRRTRAPETEGGRDTGYVRTGGEGPGEGGDPEVGGGAGRPQHPGGGGHGHDPGDGAADEERDWLLGAASALSLSRRVRSARWW